MKNEIINILCTKDFFQKDINYLKEKLNVQCNLIQPKGFTEKKLLEYMSIIHVILGSNFTKSMLDKGENLRLIQVPWTGISTLDFELLSNYNIPVCNSHSHALSVAEFCVGLMLSLAKKIPIHDKFLRSGDWNRPKEKGETRTLSNFSSYISNKTVGIIGYGSIGKKIVKLLSGFNCKFIAISNSKDKIYPELIFHGDYRDLNYLLRESDYVIVSVPLTHNTRNMLNSYNLSNMKKSAYLINISRGELINESALYDILKNGKIAGAAIDTWYNYPSKDEPNALPSKNYTFHILDNIIMSSHRAGFIENEMPHLDDAIENINRLVLGAELINLIDIKKGY